MFQSVLQKLHLLLLLLWSAVPVFAQAPTVVTGIVMDAKTKEPLPYVTIQFNEGQIGVYSDINGRFRLETPNAAKQVVAKYVGYATQTLKIKSRERTELKIALQEATSALQEVTISVDKSRRKRYKNDNPAVDLIQEVFKHRDENRKEGLDYYQLEKHERLRFDLNGVTDNFRKKWYFKPFRFVFNYCDTNQVTQKVTLPFYFRERLLEGYFRKHPQSKKERLMGERQTALDDDYDVDQDGVSAYLNTFYNDIDIYEPNIMLLDKQFMGPLSPLAPAFYRFYITDTVKMGDERFANVFFAPKNKNDLAFMGNLLVALDSSYAVRHVEMGISRDINLNWVADLRIEQHFEFEGTDPAVRRLLLRRETVLMDMKIWKNREGRSLLAVKNNTYKDYDLNRPLPDSLFVGKNQLLNDTGKVKERPNEYWIANRHDTLTTKELRIDTMVREVKDTRMYKFLKRTGYFLGTGYQRVGKIEIGDTGTFYSFNDVEGNRFQLSARTQDRYFKKMRLNAYVAYGIKDQGWKYGARGTFGIKGARPGRFPANQIRLSYDHDVSFPGNGSFGGQSLLFSLQRGGTNRMLLNRVARVEYTKEFKRGLGMSINLRRADISAVGELSEAPDNPGFLPPNSITTEFGGWFRFAPNEVFYQGREERSAIQNRWPVFFLQYRVGVKGFLGSTYGFQRASLNINKNFYLGVLGKTQTWLEFGQVFGQVSYPFLEIHRANQSFIFNDYAFNLMNYLEFVSDQYTTLHVNHDFGGLLLNRLPLIKKLRWREGASFKALYGSLREQNIPTAQNGLVPFPADEQGMPLVRTLGRVPYMEAGLGIGNIFGFLRVEYVWRLNYLDRPDAPKGGVRLMFRAGF